MKTLALSIALISVGAALLLSVLFTKSKPEPRKDPLHIETILLCDNSTLVICLEGDYKDVRQGKYELYRDINRNKKLDNDDQISGFTTDITLGKEISHFTKPVQLDSTWTKGYIFLRLISGTDTLVSTVADCDKNISYIKSF